VARATDLYWEVPGSNVVLEPDQIVVFICGISQFLINAWILPQIMPKPNGSHFAIYYSLITLLCDTVYSELLPELLNKLNIKSEFVPAHDMKVYWGDSSMSPLILNLDTRWEWVSYWQSH